MSVDIARLSLEIDSRQLRKAGTQMEWFTDRGERAERQMVRLRTSSRAMGGSLLVSNRQFQALGATAQRVGRNLSLYIGAPLLAIGAKMTNVGATFETELTKINTLVGISQNELLGMEQQILSLSRETGRGATELARALFTVTSAGARGSEALEILERASKASAIGLGETRSIAQATTAILQAYGTENIDAARATDILASTVRAGNLEAASLAPTLGRVVGLASQLGISFEELGANVATVTRLGVSAEEAITGLRGVLNTLISPTQQGAEALDEYGISFEGLREMVRSEGLANALIFLLDKFEGQDEALSKIIPNVRALSNVLGTAGVQADSYAQILQDIEEGHGIVNEGFETVGETAQAQWDQAKASVEAATISLRDSTLPIMKELAEIIQETADWFSELDSQTQANIVRFGLFAIAAGPVLMVFGRMIRMLPRIIGLMRGLQVALATNPWTAAIGVAGGLAALLAGRYLTSTQEATEATGDFSKALMDQNQALEDAQGLLEGLTLQKIMDSTQEAIRLTRREMEDLRGTLQGYFDQVQASGNFQDSTFQEWLEAVTQRSETGQHGLFLQLQRQLESLEEQRETVIELNRLENELAQAKANTGTVARQRIPILEEEIDNLRDLIGLSSKYTEEQEKTNEAIETGNESTRERIELQKDLFDSLVPSQRMIDPLELMDEYLLGFPVSIAQAEEAMRMLEESFDNALGQTQRDELRKYIEHLQEIIREMRGIEEAADDVEIKTDNLSETARRLGFTFSSAAEDAIVSWQGFGNLMNRILDDALRITTRLLVTEPLGTGLTNLFDGFRGATKEHTVGDALVKSDGTVVHIDPNDNALFMKDLGAMGNIGGSKVNVNVSVINNTDSDVSIQQHETPDGNVEIFAVVERAVTGLMDSGKLDRAANRNWGIKRPGMRR